MDRAILCTGSVVRNLIDGYQTQDRRPLSHPLARCHVGDRLWVRENFTPQTNCTDGVIMLYEASRARAGSEAKVLVPMPGGSIMPKLNIQRPSIHMPRWASRLTLVVTEVRQQRLRDISSDDAQAEGIQKCYLTWSADGEAYGRTPRDAFSALWGGLYGEGSWDANPEVVALTFTVHHCNIDRMPATLVAA